MRAPIYKKSLISPRQIIGSPMSKLCLFLIIFLMAAPIFANPEEKKGFWGWETLTGGWGGMRERLSEKGVDFEFIYTGDVMSNISGGIQRQTDYLDNVDLTLSLDMEKLVHWKGASFFFYGIGNQGGSPSLNSGDAQGPSNIESPDAWKLHEAWFQQKLFQDNLSILLGLYDLNSEFDSIETASLFLNASQGMGIDFAQSGQNGPSAFPSTSLAARLRLEPKPWFYIQTAVLDGVPGDPNDPYSTQIQFDEGDGLLIATELGFLPGELEEGKPYGKLALGAWFYTGKFDHVLDVDSLGNPVRKKGSFGLYTLGEYNVFREKNDENQGLSVYARFGYANPSLNPINYYMGFGAVYTGLIPGRNGDQFGIAVANAINGKKFQQSQRRAGSPVKKTETNVEISYRAQLTPWLAMQPDVQFIINPGMDPAKTHAIQAGLRFEVTC